MIQEAPPLAFPSLAELQEAHDALLQARDLQGDATPALPDFWARVAAFVARAEASGALIDLSRDRRAVQSILDYWANALYRANQPTPAARLADFDPLLAPELPDEPCPYQGLAAFGQDQQAFFFGRARLVQEMVQRLQRGDRLLAVAGASGSGKSSVVLAGLLPALRRGAVTGSEAWRAITLNPGSQPLANLAAAVTVPPDGPPTLPVAQAAQLVFASDGLRVMRATLPVCWRRTARRQPSWSSISLRNSSPSVTTRGRALPLCASCLPWWIRRKRATW